MGKKSSYSPYSISSPPVGAVRLLANTQSFSITLNYCTHDPQGVLDLEPHVLATFTKTSQEVSQYALNIFKNTCTEIQLLVY